MRFAPVIAVDTSALLAIVFNERERNDFREIIRLSDKALMSAVTAIETRIVVHSRRGERGLVLFNGLIALPAFELVPPGTAELEAAYAAFVAYGKGSGHPASLNFGDLFSYALAKVRAVPLLFKGNDFAQTDIQPAAEAL
jgi:ribonuclease VapC